jgi:dihydroorotate dehydrogenase (fumarate)/dihydroorotate dehydrogenase
LIYQRILRPILFRCDAEWIHDRAIGVSRVCGSIRLLRSLIGLCCNYSDQRLASDVAGLRFPNPIGLAAGWDKSGRAIRMMPALGFGFVEIGSVSADPSEGNPRPRLWRLPADQAICVHYGLPNDGAAAVAARLAGAQLPVPLGINIVKTNRGMNAPADTAEAVYDDYVRSAAALKDAGDYLCLNLSCPNTECGRDFFSIPGRLAELLSRLEDLQLACPVFLKVSPVGGVAAIEQLLEAVDPFSGVSGFMFNLPPGKPDGLRTPRSAWESLPGAVAGKPAQTPLDDRLRELYQRMDRARFRLMASGGVFSAEDAYRKIRLGASLVQLMTGLVYEGPGLIARINRGLVQLLERDGFAHITEAVGTGGDDR